MLLFRKVPNQMAPFFVILGQNVKQKRFHVIVERFMIQKKFCQKAQILTVNFIDVTVHLKHRNFPAPVYFSGGRMSPGALVLVSFQYCNKHTGCKIVTTNESNKINYQLYSWCILGKTRTKRV